MEHNNYLQMVFDLAFATFEMYFERYFWQWHGNNGSISSLYK